MRRTAQTTWRKKRTRPAGYTLVELLVTITILGIISAIVVPQMLAAQPLVAQAATRTLAADIMFAQNEAIAQQRTHKLTFDAVADTYSLVQINEEGTESAADLGDNTGAKSADTVDFRSDKRFRGIDLISVDFGGGQTLAFDDLGAPSGGGTIRIAYQEYEYIVTVTEFTGRVTIERVDAAE